MLSFQIKCWLEHPSILSLTAGGGSLLLSRYANVPTKFRWGGGGQPDRGTQRTGCGPWAVLCPGLVKRICEILRMKCLQRCPMCTAADETPQHEDEERAVLLPLSSWKTVIWPSTLNEALSASHPLLMFYQPMYYQWQFKYFSLIPFQLSLTIGIFIAVEHRGFAANSAFKVL